MPLLGLSQIVVVVKVHYYFGSGLLYVLEIDLSYHRNPYLGFFVLYSKHLLLTLSGCEPRTPNPTLHTELPYLYCVKWIKVVHPPNLQLYWGRLEWMPDLSYREINVLFLLQILNLTCFPHFMPLSAKVILILYRFMSKLHRLHSYLKVNKLYILFLRNLTDLVFEHNGRMLIQNFTRVCKLLELRSPR